MNAHQDTHNPGIKNYPAIWGIVINRDIRWVSPGDYTTQLYMGIVINHYKDPY